MVEQKSVYSCEYVKYSAILALLLINYCIIFHTNHCKPTFAQPCILRESIQQSKAHKWHEYKKEGGNRTLKIIANIFMSN